MAKQTKSVKLRVNVVKGIINEPGAIVRDVPVDTVFKFVSRVVDNSGDIRKIISTINNYRNINIKNTICSSMNKGMVEKAIDKSMDLIGGDLTNQRYLIDTLATEFNVPEHIAKRLFVFGVLLCAEKINIPSLRLNADHISFGDSTSDMDDDTEEDDLFEMEHEDHGLLSQQNKQRMNLFTDADHMGQNTDNNEEEDMYQGTEVLQEWETRRPIGMGSDLGSQLMGDDNVEEAVDEVSDAEEVTEETHDDVGEVCGTEETSEEVSEVQQNAITLQDKFKEMYPNIYALNYLHDPIEGTVSPDEDDITIAGRITDHLIEKGYLVSVISPIITSLLTTHTPMAMDYKSMENLIAKTCENGLNVEASLRLGEDLDLEVATNATNKILGWYMDVNNMRNITKRVEAVRSSGTAPKNMSKEDFNRYLDYTLACVNTIFPKLVKYRKAKWLFALAAIVQDENFNTNDLSMYPGVVAEGVTQLTQAGMVDMVLEYKDIYLAAAEAVYISGMEHIEAEPSRPESEKPNKPVETEPSKPETKPVEGGEPLEFDEGMSENDKQSRVLSLLREILISFPNVHTTNVAELNVRKKEMEVLIDVYRSKEYKGFKFTTLAPSLISLKMRAEGNIKVINERSKTH